MNGSAIESFAFLEQRSRAALRELELQGLRRALRSPSGVDLSSNDYLALAQHPHLRDRLAQAVDQYGCGSTGSRLLRGHRDCFGALEERFARFKGAERALYFTSGYMANLAAAATFTEPGDVTYSDRLNHASLIDGIRLSKARAVVYPHCDAQRVEELIAAGDGGFLITESLFSMDGDRAPLAQYAELLRNHNIALVVDEAHSVGIFGERGSGLLEETGTSSDVFLSINTAGKALGVAGAFVCGPEWAIDYLIQRARPFLFSTAAPPALAAAMDAALDLIEGEPERRTRLRELARYFRRALLAAGLQVEQSDSPIVPIILGANDRTVAAAEALQRAGFDTRAIRPPTVPEGTARLRVTVNLNLDETILDRFIAELCRVL